MVTYGVLQDALEQHGEFFGWPVAIAFGQLKHGVLHNIESGMLVTNGVLSLFIGASFGLGEEFGKLLWRRQFFGSGMVGAAY